MDKTTAKIDVQKLQLLNDRICQTIDALNQVRMSMHGFTNGLGHNIPAFYPQAPFYGTQSYYGAQPFYGQSVFGGQNPYAVQNPLAQNSYFAQPFYGHYTPFHGVPATLPISYQTVGHQVPWTNELIERQRWSQQQATAYAPVYAQAPIAPTF